MSFTFWTLYLILVLLGLTHEVRNMQGRLVIINCTEWSHSREANKRSTIHMKPESFPLCSQEPAIRLCPELDESNPSLIMFL
jgi:hypothetical protein